MFFGVGFSVAKSYSLQAEANVSLLSRIKQLGSDPFILVGLSSIVLGILLNLSGLDRPAFFTTINAVCIPIGTLLLLVSIGMALKFGRIGAYLRECLLVSIIKFFLVPVCVSMVAWLIGYGALNGGLPLKVVMILSSMPVAFNALVASSIYEVDLDLANSCFLCTTSLLVLVLPMLSYAIQAV
jgi:hypothetical protein